MRVYISKSLNTYKCSNKHLELLKQETNQYNLTSFKVYVNKTNNNMEKHVQDTQADKPVWINMRMNWNRAIFHTISFKGKLPLVLIYNLHWGMRLTSDGGLLDVLVLQGLPVTGLEYNVHTYVHLSPSFKLCNM